MNIKHLMSENVIAVNINSSLEEISEIMKEQDVGMVLIEDNNKIIGLLTDRDIITKIISNRGNKIDFYTKDLVTIDVDNKVDNALKLMSRYKIKRLIVTENNKVVGIISLSDLINCEEDLLVDTLKSIWEINRNIDSFNTKINEFYL